MNVQSKILAAALLVSAAAAPAFAGPETASDTASASALIIQPITVTKDRDMEFGTLVKPRSGSAKVTVANDGTRTLGTGIASPTSSAAPTSAMFTIKGEGAQAMTVAVPATFELANGANKLTVTTSNDGSIASTGTTKSLSGALGAEGSYTVKVGGEFDLASSTATGTYTGSFTVTAAYN
jgi:hypothetical protein